MSISDVIFKVLLGPKKHRKSHQKPDSIWDLLKRVCEAKTTKIPKFAQNHAFSKDFGHRTPRKTKKLSNRAPTKIQILVLICIKSNQNEDPQNQFFVREMGGSATNDDQRQRTAANGSERTDRQTGLGSLPGAFGEVKQLLKNYATHEWDPRFRVLA